MTPERIKEIDVTKERDEARKERQELLEELAFQKEFFREMNDQRQGLIIRMMNAERLDKILVENISQTIQERDKAERELAKQEGVECWLCSTELFGAVVVVVCNDNRDEHRLGVFDQKYFQVIKPGEVRKARIVLEEA